MLTRRENLLVRPWQQRRFQSHRRKVQSALPAIDATAPQSRAHVTCKLKKIQSEGERIERIETDNVRLLQRMAAIMRTSRLDNRWIEEPPGSFLGRIGIYAPLTSAPTSRRSSGASEVARLEAAGGRWGGRKAACSACRLREEQAQLPSIRQVTPEEKELPIISTETESENTPTIKKKKKKKRVVIGAEYRTKDLRYSDWSASNNRVVLTRGQLRVSVSFPSHTGVTLERAGARPTILEAEFCTCAALLPCKP